MTTEQHTFTAEVQELLNLMVHSLYSQKDIFLRELISNSSDALDRLRVEGHSDPSLLPEGELEIRLEVDTEARTLSISDNGIGMSRDEVVENIGTIARSGSREFLSALRQKQAGDQDAATADLIGQFGVGFYSTFMVAERVSLVTRRAGTDVALRWESGGDGSYTIDAADRPSAGTTVTLHLKPVDEEDGLRDYTDQFVLREIVKKHSDFVAHPIRMKVEREEPVLDNTGTPVEGVLPKKVVEDETLNSMKAIWTRSKSEVSEEEYNEFYRLVSHDWQDPVATIPAAMEGTFNARILLYIPSKAPFDLYHRERVTKGVQLYVKRVHIMDDWKALLPEWLRFLKGVIDCEDLSLNVSREILQHDRQVKAIRSFAVKKTLEAIDRLKKDDPEKMRALWQEFGAVLKEGLAAAEDDYRDRLLGVTLAASTVGDELTSLDDYLARMKPDQESIYYLVGSSLDAIRQSPLLESFARRGLEVALFTDPVDEFWLEREISYKDKTLVSISKGELDLGDLPDEPGADESTPAPALDGLLQALRTYLQDEVKDVRVSSRLTDSPVCLVGDANDLSPQLEQMMRQLGQDPPKTKRVLEINPTHPFIGKLSELEASDAPASALETYARMLYGQAILAEGGTLPDPGAYSRVLMDLAHLAVGVPAASSAPTSAEGDETASETNATDNPVTDEPPAAPPSDA